MEAPVKRPEKSSRSIGLKEEYAATVGPSVPGEGRASAHERVFRHESRWYHGQFVRPEPFGSGRFLFGGYDALRGKNTI